MWGLSRREPYPWDVQFEHRSLPQPLGILLVTAADGAKLLRRQTTGLENVTPTDFSYASGSPFARRTARFARLVMGMGQAVQASEASQRYRYALGVDWSCGLGFLAPLFATPFQVGTGPIRDITQFVYGGTTTLAVLSGSRVYLSSAGTINDLTDFALDKDFSTALTTPAAPSVVAATLPSPSAPTVTNTGASGVAAYSYKIVAINATDPPHSAASVAGTNSSAAASLNNLGDANHITWTAIPSAPIGTQYQVWRTAVVGGSPATLGLIGTTASFAFDDEGQAPTIAGAPPSAALTGSTTYSYKVSAVGGAGGVSGASTVLLPTSAASSQTTITNGPPMLDSLGYFVVTVSWVSTGAAAYQVWRTAGGTSPPQLVATVTGGVTSFIDSGVSGVTLTPPAAAIQQTPRGMVVTSQGAINQRLFVAVDSGNFWAYNPATTSWEQADWTGPALWEERALFFRYDTVKHKIRSTDRDPLHALDGNWTDYYGSDDAYQITCIIPFGGTVLLFDEQRVSTATADLTPNANVGPSLDNGRTAIPWLGAVYAPFGTGWYRYTVSGSGVAFESIGIERLLENDTPIKGRVTAQCGWNAWHQFFTEYDEVAGVSYLMKFGAWVSPEQATDPNASLIPAIHGALESWSKKATWLAISTAGEPSGNPRLYVGFSDGYLTSAILPRSNPYAPGDPACRFRLNGDTVLPRHSMGFQADTKLYQDLTAWGPVLDATRQLTARAVFEDNAAGIDLLGAIRESGELLTFPDGQSGKWIQPIVTWQRSASDATLTPVVEGIALHEQLKPSFVEQFGLTARTGPLLVNRAGNPSRVSGDELLLQLRDLAAYGDDVTVVLPDGSRHTVAVVNVEDRLLAGNDRAAEQHAVSLTLAKFQTVTPSTA